jgi:UDPglucose--hexose-1-phosphate uridylyltransferase
VNINHGLTNFLFSKGREMIEMERPHRRLNPLTGEWILVSPHRASRPWLGQMEKVPSENLPAYDPTCYLCPGNRRAGSSKNPEYQGTFVFDNDFPALLPPSNADAINSEILNPRIFRSDQASGICRVVCFSPRHDLTLPELSQDEVEAVIHTWSNQSKELGRRSDITYVQIFENKGALMGCSNPHPHSQIWATSFVPDVPTKELNSLLNYYETNAACILCEYIEAEIKIKDRLVFENRHFVAVVPFWAVWPFEILVVSQRHMGSLNEMTPAELKDLASLMRQITIYYDNLFEISFPYSMGIHQAPTDGEEHPESHLHIHFYPPLLRSATVRKFMVGFEMLAMPQRDLTPETAAEKLRTLKTIHYKWA